MTTITFNYPQIYKEHLQGGKKVNRKDQKRLVTGKEMCP